jgi:hypothetical protein
MQTRAFFRYQCRLTAAILVLLAGACASDGRGKTDAFETRVARNVAQLTQAGDADSLAAAAEFSRLGNDGPVQQLRLLERATALAPQRADLLWLKVMVCTHTEGCDPAPFAEALHKLDPGNGAAWAPLIDRATKLNDAAAVHRYLAAMGGSPRFDLYWNTRIAHLTNALIKVDAHDAGMALMNVTGMEAAVSIPVFKNITGACRGDALQDEERLMTCRGIVGAMLEGDTYIVEMVGASLAKRLWPEGSAAYSAAAGAWRVAQYRIRARGRLEYKLMHKRDALECLSLMQSHRTEQDLTEAILSRAGVSAMPPADWQEPI